MDTTETFVGLACVDCDAVHDPDETTGRCPDCGGILDPTYDYDAVDVSRKTFESRRFDTMWRYAELLPFARESAVTMDEGATALVDCPALADELGVGRVLVKDEGRNPTGTVADRGQSLAVTAAAAHDASDVALASTGESGQSASAYAARAGVDSHVFVPTRSGFTNKAMVNVHGGDMTVVEGRIGDAEAAFDDALADEPDWHSLGAFHTPYRHEGQKTALYETVEQLDWAVPDAVVYPTGSGTGLVGMHKAAGELVDLGLTDDTPAMYAAQAEGCAPVVRAFEEDRDVPEPWQQPDTICGTIEIPDPAGGALVLDALRESDGGAVATSDQDILDAAVTAAQHEGLELSPSAAAAAAGAWELAERDELDAEDTVVLANTSAGSKEDDVLRSHLMSKGI
ncbi:threonine synthase [Halospeciosus flavus]|uniref:Threonine synthase n=1 Tax=Halospeciosus flavus TaxID=3032283 RepID=A0ABD5Z4B1_9EURY|nr:threonine synthase [Halospeciosus flavus]